MATAVPVLVAQHWRERAADARTLADWIDDAEAKRLLAQVAERYEAIATSTLADWTDDAEAKRLLAQVAERYEAIATIVEAGRLNKGEKRPPT